MSDRKRMKRRSDEANREGQTPMSNAARELELRAIEEQFLSEQRAGLHPRLSTYLRRYPDFGAELAATIALTFIPDSQAAVALIADGRDEGAHEKRTALSSGTWRALENIFGSDMGETTFGQSRVAERRADYISESVPKPPARGTGDQEQ